MRFLNLRLILIALLFVSCSDDDENIEPLAVTLETPTYVTGISITLEWSRNFDEDFQAYRLYYSTSEGVSETSNLAVKLTNNTLTSYTFTGLDTDVQYYFKVYVIDEGGLSSESNEVTATTSAVASVKLPDPQFEAIIRETLNKPMGDITLDNMLLITELDGKEREISDIRGIEYCANLVQLDLYANQIIDISPLSGLTSLIVLSLRSNRIIDISPLSGLTNLDNLTLWDNQIIDISPLSWLTNLNYLTLIGNQIVDISPLSGLTNLNYLNLWGSPIIDISPLSGLTNLTSLYLGSNRIGDISPLSELTNLGVLFLSSNQIIDISPLSRLTKLRLINICCNQIVDISPFSGLTNLTSLYLGSNRIVDIKPLVDNTGINQGDAVVLSANPLNEISINTYIPELRERGVNVTWP